MKDGRSDETSRFVLGLIDRASLERYLAPAAQPAAPVQAETVLQKAARNKGGRRATAVPQNVVIEATASLMADGLPDKLADIERRIQDLMVAHTGENGNESTVRECAQKLREAYLRNS